MNVREWVEECLQNSRDNGYDPASQDPRQTAMEMIDYSLDDGTRLELEEDVGCDPDDDDAILAAVEREVKRCLNL